MKSVPNSLISVIGALMLAGAAGLALASDDGEDNRNPPKLSVADVASRLESSGYRNITQIERERSGYEVEATDPNGTRVELRVDGNSGDLLRTEKDD